MKVILLIIALVMLMGALPTRTELQDFTSVDELREFLKADNTNEVIYLVAGKDGVITFNGQCEDFAIQLRDRAAAIGKNLEVIPLNRYEYQKWYGVLLDYNVYHMINMAIIGNNVYYIEPQDDRVWLALHLD